ncbi:TPA: hypothetical protein N0F65_008180 [Lagenidium giganteum]|uniref:Late embryogenesis abundant protein LEA-2 subgroup domain-containing protein n=1 Tax=Lagenidium giganteum TaxID=4803 RepID=A0AAV2YJZ7_9STRA|nr:TPA: hypothetical protein N0F65_008180 [Lagenidium giganteum]
MSKRRRIMIIVVTVLLLVASILLAIFVGGKLYAQSLANKVDISLNYMDLNHIDPGGDTRTVNVTFSVRMKHDTPVSARMDAATVGIDYGGQRVCSVEILAQKFKDGPQEYDIIIQESIVEIADLAGFSQMAKALLSAREVSMTASADVTVHAASMTYSGIKVRRTFALQGMNKFSTPAPVITQITLADCTIASTTMVVNTTIDNISQFGMNSLGRLNLTIYYNKDFLGYAISTNPDQGLPRGSSTQQFTVTLPNSVSMTLQLLSMGVGIVAKHAQFYIKGENADATQIYILRDAIKALDMSVLYTGGLSTMGFGGGCGPSKIVGIGL